MTTTTITWASVATHLPDDEELVLCALPDGDVCAGWLDAGEWRYADALPMLEPPTHWATMPEGPEVTR